MTCNTCQFCIRQRLTTKTFWYCQQTQNRKSKNGHNRIRPDDKECDLYQLSDQKPYVRKNPLRTSDEVKDAAVNDYFNNMNDTLETIAERHNVSHTTLSVWISAHYKAKFARVASLRGAG